MSMSSAAHVKEHLEQFGLTGKIPEHIAVCGWLPVVTAFVKWRVNALTTWWDDKIKKTFLSQMIADIFVMQADPVNGTWCISRQDVTVWIDASSLTTGVVVKSNGAVAEDATWLWPVCEGKHINLAELDAVLRGINLALQLKVKTIHLWTDSTCVHCWISDTLSRQTRVRTKAPSEMLIRCWLATLRKLAAEYELDIDMELVKFHDNQADQLTRVPWQWLEEIRIVCTVAEELDVAGVKQMLYFVKLFNTRVPRAAVQAMVRDCREYQSIDPALVHWKPGRLDVSENWSRVEMDVTHFGN